MCKYIIYSQLLYTSMRPFVVCYSVLYNFGQMLFRTVITLCFSGIRKKRVRGIFIT